MARLFNDFSLSAIAVLLMAGVSAPAMSSQVGQDVGSVTLVLGQATVISSSGERSPIQRGSAVMSGDSVETAAGGHVHIRFIDNALVSVRPSSRLVIEEYQYDPKEVANSQVRFRLDSGVARAISGAAAEGARERFRLNTPLVAIGVRGTDFVVSSQANQTTAHVNQGAIIMTPIGAGCSASAYGPCNTNATMLVSAQMGDVLAEYRTGFSHPEIKPQMLAAGASYFAAVQVDGQQPSVSTVGGASGMGTTQAARLDDSTISAKQDNGVVQASSVVRNGFIASVVDGRGQLPIPEAPAPVAPIQPPEPPLPPSLAWGHWVNQEGSNDFSEPFGVAAIGREVTVGNRTYVLYRSLPVGGGATSIQPSLGEVSFQLQQANAQFRPWGGANQDATAQNGALSINFASRKFQTTLQLDNSMAGSHLLTTSGVVLVDGIFGGTNGQQSAIGAATLDGKGAGYFFDKTVDRGVFSGITLWGK